MGIDAKWVGLDLSSPKGYPKHATVSDGLDLFFNVLYQSIQATVLLAWTKMADKSKRENHTGMPHTSRFVLAV